MWKLNHPTFDCRLYLLTNFGGVTQVNPRGSVYYFFKFINVDHKVWDLATKGREFHNYSSEERKQHLQSICILARLSLSNELLIMRTLKEMSEVVITYRQWY